MPIGDDPYGAVPVEEAYLTVDNHGTRNRLMFDTALT
jgi:hypothetical protein